MSAGLKFKKAVKESSPLLIVGAASPLVAMLIERKGFQALYLSGGGYATFSFGLPDLGMTTPVELAEEARRIADRSSLPLLVDIDTGFGGPLMIERTVQLMEQAGVAAVHIEDQVFEKRCGHRQGKALVAKGLMQERIAAAVRGRKDPDFVIMARTDSPGIEKVGDVVKRAQAYREAGADMLFLEGSVDSELFRVVKEECGLPLLVNLTEFGKCKILTASELNAVGADMALYPLTLNRVMLGACSEALDELRAGQGGLLEKMQTRVELYDLIGYHDLEARSKFKE
ncbi:isocitrate lyase/phosphoenolpyruvate mutase family protein [Estrella lausannensis]|uniref:2-methylisocitrate lyase n=1 Tax=Estrella lausannensis TaxID=483423 RepID=A0A0H5DQZ1_9BACT|nr:isocitrate lyase/phosphoenolpyruvate mutase family protein [Estrella lausannensis]CRX39071.1 Methylisocitrate lyase [Estrella lausannensis]